LNWLCFSFNEKEQFWENLKRDYTNNKLNCYEARLEEIINCCRSTKKNIGKLNVQSLQEGKETKFSNGGKESGLQKMTILVTIHPVSSIEYYIK
jgi:hypothetical protein